MSSGLNSLYAYLDQLGIAYSTVEHPPMFTASDAREWHDKVPGLHCKSLFMKDKRGRLWLAVLPQNKRAHLSEIEKQSGSARLSFVRPELLSEVLGVTPGSVTPFALINDTARRVSVILDAELMQSESINLHPLRNDASTTIKTADLLLFIRSFGYSPLVFDCAGYTARGRTE
jgi:Ala-tRNA(Pro) deacylase